MTRSDLRPSRAETARSAAIDDLFDALAQLSAAYQDLPEAERIRRCSADAERITAEVALQLSTARGRLAAPFDRRRVARYPR